jgi:Arc/MetJ-type ribon-helix-helix transcriptional regulator
MTRTHTIHLSFEDDANLRELVSRIGGSLDTVIRDALRAQREADDAELDAALGPLVDDAEADYERGEYHDFAGRDELWAYLPGRS